MIDHFGNVEILIGRHLGELSAEKSGQRVIELWAPSLPVILGFFQHRFPSPSIGSRI
jgi:hypothetical protein